VEKVSKNSRRAFYTVVWRTSAMFTALGRHGGRCARRSIATTTFTSASRRAHASRIDVPFTPPPVPVIERCPVPTCQCRPVPEGLGIERERNISGSMAAHAEQVLISTGRSNWKSRIEDEEGTPDAALVKQLKKFLGRGGKYSDVGAHDSPSLPPPPAAVQIQTHTVDGNLDASM
jgi:hypothetical protein